MMALIIGASNTMIWAMCSVISIYKDRHLSISNILNWLLQLVVLGKIFPVIWKSDNWNPNYTIQCTVIRNIKQQNTSCSGILRIEINKWFWPLSNWP